MRRLVLASTSPMRRQLLATAGLAVEAVAPGVDEASAVANDPVGLVRELAHRKAVAVAHQHPDAWVIGADQVVFDPALQQPWGKPPDPATHRARLMAMRGAEHHLVTGLAVVGPGIDAVEHQLTRLVVRGDVSDEEIAAYVATGEGAWCAGGYAAEAKGSFLFERIDGDWSNVMGLPLFRLYDLLRRHGWRFGATA